VPASHYRPDGISDQGRSLRRIRFDEPERSKRTGRLEQAVQWQMGKPFTQTSLPADLTAAVPDFVLSATTLALPTAAKLTRP
jgi:hypothetical protein